MSGENLTLRDLKDRLNHAISIMVSESRAKCQFKQVRYGNGIEVYGGCTDFLIDNNYIYQVYDAVKIPIIGLGGVATAEDVIEFMLAGETAVQVGTANLVNPCACRDIINDLPRVMEKYNIKNLSDIIGGAK